MSSILVVWYLGIKQWRYLMTSNIDEPNREEEELAGFTLKPFLEQIWIA